MLQNFVPKVTEKQQENLRNIPCVLVKYVNLKVDII